MTIRCSGGIAVGENRFVGEIGHSRARGSAARPAIEPVAMTKRRGRMSMSPARDAARAGEPRLAAQHRDPEPLEPLDRIIRRDARDDLADTVGGGGEIDSGRAEAMPSAAQRRQVGELCGGEQRFRRDAAKIEAVAAHQAALDQHDARAHLRRPGGDRKPAGAGADDAQVGGERRAGLAGSFGQLGPAAPRQRL